MILLFPYLAMIILTLKKLSNYLLIHSLQHNIRHSCTSKENQKKSLSKIRLFFQKLKSIFSFQNQKKKSNANSEMTKNGNRMMARGMTRSEYYSEYKGDLHREDSELFSSVYQRNPTKNEEIDSVKRNKVQDIVNIESEELHSDPNMSEISDQNNTIPSSDNFSEQMRRSKLNANTINSIDENEPIISKNEAIKSNVSSQENKENCFSSDLFSSMTSNVNLLNLFKTDKIVINSEVLHDFSEYNLKFYLTPARFYSLKNMGNIKKISKDLLWGANNASNKNKIENAKLMYQEKSQENLEEIMGNFDSSIMNEESIWNEFSKFSLDVMYPSLNVDSVRRSSNIMMGLSKKSTQDKEIFPSTSTFLIEFYKGLILHCVLKSGK